MSDILSRSAGAPMRVAIQGQVASFHDVAARQFFGNDIELVCCELPFARVFNALENAQAEYAVCAIENSLYGTIPEVYDLLLKRQPWICGEVVLHIQQCLVGLPGATPADITEVYSHPVALAQCEQYLTTTLSRAKRFSSDDTAGSAAKVAAWADTAKAAIASEAAAQQYGLAVLQRGIEDDTSNYTRFAVIQRSPSKQLSRANKTSLVITTSHRAGALYHVLKSFAERTVNLSLLVSRPIIGQPGKYLFYIDVEIGLEEPAMQLALREIEQLDCDARVLGSYIKAQR